MVSAAGFPALLVEFREALRSAGWVSDLYAAGSIATGDYVPRVSDIDLVAVLRNVPDSRDMSRLVALHRRIDSGPGAGFALGCSYVSADQIADLDVRHPTWTHGRFIRRTLSGITRAELVQHPVTLLGRTAHEVFPAVSEDDVRDAVRSELLGPWTSALRWPPSWYSPTFADLSLTSMARARLALDTGRLMTKTVAIEHCAGPPWLRQDLRRRRNGENVCTHRARTAALAYTDAHRTTRLGRAV